ncbi:hypothetical protein H0H93_008443 [Arthromyces matolae]|nr:hypothetical protein H0H93_008443 [Arthromyces matolae]
MSLSWRQRKQRLASLLKTVHGDDDAEGLSLDRILHGQSVIGKTAKTTQIDTIRFSDKDLKVLGALEYGQFGVVRHSIRISVWSVLMAYNSQIYVVTCKLDGRVYVRKSIDKKFVLRNRDQCSPQIERDILLQARKTNSEWAPHLLCAFQTSTHLNLIMDYAEGGNLWDVLESSPLDGRVNESDLMWWAPQLISAIHWCHSQGFVHRDIKPHNFVLTPDAHILLIDFGSAAPLLPSDSTGAQKVLKRYCLIPCGTCDYISPEILHAHEEALVALEIGDDETTQLNSEGYGRETDWWSLGAMLYEMVYGNAPFFAKDIRQTYMKIIDHEKCLRFGGNPFVSTQCQDFLSKLLTSAERRLGRRDVQDITAHPLFHRVDWNNLDSCKDYVISRMQLLTMHFAVRAPSDLHLPQFAYAEPANLAPSPVSPVYEARSDEADSQAFAFSALFQSSEVSASPGLTILRSKSSPDPPRPLEEETTASFIGFSWGPTLEAFHDPAPTFEDDLEEGHTLSYMNTPRPLRISSRYISPNAGYITPRFSAHATPQLVSRRDKFTTPVRPTSLPPPGTLLRTGTVRRTGERRTLTDREAMKQLVDCVGMSARKKVLESGRKPRILTRSGTRSRAGSLTRKELRFNSESSLILGPNHIPALKLGNGPQITSSLLSRTDPPKPILVNHNQLPAWSGSEDTDSEDPPSPSPTPRPGSAMSTFSRRSGTPTVSFARMGTGTMSSTSTMLLGVPASSNALSLNLNHSMDLTESFRSQLAKQRAEESGDGLTMTTTSAPTPLEVMESRLASLMGDIRAVEKRLANVAAII